MSWRANPRLAYVRLESRSAESMDLDERESGGGTSDNEQLLEPTRDSSGARVCGSDVDSAAGLRGLVWPPPEAYTKPGFEEGLCG
jgi:hypothetical protein